MQMNKEKEDICYGGLKGYGKTYCEMIRLQQENKELKENFLKQTAETYLRQIRIDKAIEYIEENKMKGKYSHSGGEYDNFILLEECEINDLLEILKDSDVDE